MLLAIPVLLFFVYLGTMHYLDGDKISCIVCVVAGLLLAVFTIYNENVNSKKSKADMKDYADFTNYQQFLESNRFVISDEPNDEDYEKELKLCSEYLETNPNNEYAFIRQAGLYLNLEKFSEASENFKILIDKYKDNFTHAINYAVCVYALGDKAEAFKLLDSFYTNKPKDALYYMGLSMVYKYSKEYNIALENISHAIQLRPDDYYLYSKRADIYKKLNQFDKYEADMKKSKELYEELCKKLGIKTHNNDTEEKDDRNPNEFKNLKP